jgi:hypothetical protein
MRTLRLCAFSALAYLFVGDASSAAGAPTLQVKVLDAKTVVVRGRGFPDEKLLVSADMDIPHASVACYTDFTRVALVKGDEFEATINARHCNFRCSRDRSGYVVSVETLGGRYLAEAKFPCVLPRVGTNK